MSASKVLPRTRVPPLPPSGKHKLLLLRPADSPQGAPTLENDAFAFETKSLVEACIQTALKGSHNVSLSSDFKEIVQCVLYMKEDNCESFEDMCTQLELTTASVYLSVEQVCAGIFEDGIVNWGRVIALLAFGGHLSQYCLKNQLGQVADSLVPWIVVFVSLRLKGWIVDRGGWESLAKLCRSHQCQQQQKLLQPQNGWLNVVISGVALGVGVFNVLSGSH